MIPKPYYQNGSYHFRALLKMAAEKQIFKSSDIEEVLPELNPRQRTYIISRLKSSGMISPIREKGREYSLSFKHNYLMRSLIQVLEQESFIPTNDE